MSVNAFTEATAILALASTAVVYGTDAFCAMVMRPALREVGDHTLTVVMGRVHRYGDRRMPIPGAMGIAATAATVVIAALGAQWWQVGTAVIALAALLAWIGVYLRVSAPINRLLTEAAVGGVDLPNARALQADWDRVIVVRAALQGVAVIALALVVAL